MQRGDIRPVVSDGGLLYNERVTSRSILVVQHAPGETLGEIAEALEARGVATCVVKSFSGETVPVEIGDHEGLVLMGGPQSVYESDRYPYLKDELRLISSALKAERPILGICLGSQLLASALGATVEKGARKEVGWGKVVLSDAALLDPLWKGVESSFVALHWHGDVFTLPQDAVSLARSDITEHQAFRYGTLAYGILFHLEMTRPMLLDMVREFPNDIRQAGQDPNAIVGGADEHLPALAQRAKGVFEAWASLLGTPREVTAQ